jgi:Icc-related predicted phosphoesterase
VKILAVSDLVLDRFYKPEIHDLFREVGLVLSCGDLPYEYLEFLVSSLNIPLLYVPGNHDPQYDEKNPASQAEGCELLDLRVRKVKGLTIAGIGGSMRYQPSRPNQYTQREMYLRLSGLLPSLLWHRFRSGGVLDILMAHSPPRGIHDDEDLPHTGFAAYVDFIRIFKPRYFIHGHTMVYKSNLVPPVTRVGSTTVINIYPYQVLEIDPPRG